MSEIVGVDASGFDRSHTSKHYTKRAALTIRRLEATRLVDTKVSAIHRLHVTATRKHDSRIAPSLIERDPERIDILLGDEGYDDRKADDLPVTTRFGHLTMLDRAS